GVFIGRTLHEPEYLSVKTVYNVKRGCPRLENCLECPKNAKCDAKKSKCQCLPGFYGPHCEFEVCSKHLNPCLNGARCQLNNASVFYCECLFGFWGDRCQFKDPLAINGGRCPKTWFGHYPLCVPCKCDPAKNNDQDCDKVTGQCYCKPYYYKKEPNSDICLPCKCHFPTGASSLMCDDFTGQCKCKNRIKGRRCTECSRKNEQINRKIGKCETVKYHCPESFHSEVLWPRTSFNTTVTVRCPKGTSGYAQRTCLSDTIFWSEPMLINCTSKRFEYLDDMLSQIESTSLQLNSYLSQQIASYLNNLTSKSLDILYGRDLHITHNLLLRLIEEELKSDVISREYGRTQDKKFIKNIVASSSEILKQDVAKLWLQNYDHEPTIEVLKQVELLDKYGTFYAKSISAGSLMKPFRIDSENI
uniref:Uncharacterized protein n=1 Tax=Romanomermis culicivorax TaxID=13658 RepID=A0A915HH26_ROMCU